MTQPTITFKSNVAAFTEIMSKIGDDLQREVVREATRAAGVVIRDKAKQLAPELAKPRRSISAKYRRVPRALKDNIAVIPKARQTAGKYIEYVRVRTGRGVLPADPYYWFFLEGGWVPFTGSRAGGLGGKRARSARARASLSSGRTTYKQFQFLAPAFAARKDAALSRFIEVVDSATARYTAMENSKELV